MGQNQWYHFGGGAPPILEPILVGMGNWGTIWILTHGHIASTGPTRRSLPFFPSLSLQARERSGLPARRPGVFVSVLCAGWMV